MLYALQRIPESGYPYINHSTHTIIHNDRFHSNNDELVYSEPQKLNICKNLKEICFMITVVLSLTEKYN
jgi:hypothetical protein